MTKNVSRSIRSKPNQTTTVKAKTSRKSNSKTKTTDLSKRQYKLEKAKLKSNKNKTMAEIEKERIKSQTKIALGGEAGATVSGSVASGIGYTSVNQPISQIVNGGMTSEGGLGREDANANNSNTETGDPNSWEDVINSLGRSMK